MMKLVLSFLLVPCFFSPLLADAPTRQALQEPVVRDGARATAGICTVIYSDYCSGWIWSTPLAAQEVVGVVFDLPADCGKAPGAACENTAFWWYWRFTNTFYEPIQYSLYEVDEWNCITGEPIGQFDVLELIERWNWYSGFGTISADRVAFTAEKLWEAPVRPPTSNNVRNQQANCAEIPAIPHSFVFESSAHTQYCPPIPVEDELGYVDFLMEAVFSVEVSTSVPEAHESSSWGAVKSLFR